MEICLHLGAHRTAASLFQSYMHDNRERLATKGVAYWGPSRLGAAMPSGCRHNNKLLQQRSLGRIRMQLSKAEANGMTHLMISDQSLIGNLRQNLEGTSFYKQKNMRLGRLASALGGNGLRIGICVRAYDTYWASVLGKRLMGGMPEQSSDALDLLVTQPRRWRNVITQVSKVFPEAEIIVWPYEAWGGQPAHTSAALLEIATDDLRPSERTRQNSSRDSFALNKARAMFGFSKTISEGQYMPFSAAQVEKLRHDYASDIAWLTKGAGGVATYLTPEKQEFGQEGWFASTPRHKNRAKRPDDRGRPNDRQEARMG